jgi:hypothetical protein
MKIKRTIHLGEAALATRGKQEDQNEWCPELHHRRLFGELENGSMPRRGSVAIHRSIAAVSPMSPEKTCFGTTGSFDPRERPR